MAKQKVNQTQQNNIRQSYTNSSSGGGTGYFIDLGGLKIAWGLSGSFSTATAGNFSASLPSGFFTTIQHAQLSLYNATNAGLTITPNSYTTSSLVGFVNGVGGSTSQLSWLAIGT